MTTRAAQQMRSYFTAPVEKRLETARRLHCRHGRELGRDLVIRSFLDRAARAADDLEQHMLAMDMGRRCSACAARAGGGCCSAVMADNSDAILLLINMLLRGTVKEQQTSTECRFLGQSGCTLAIKPIFCLNYNCSQIRDAATEGEMEKLEHLAGRLLGVQTELENLLLERLG